MNEGREPPSLPAGDATSPPPSAATTRLYWRPPGPTGGLGAAVTACLAGLIGVLILQVGTSIAMLIRADPRQEELARARLVFADGWEIGVYLAMTLLLVLTGILWMVWQYRAHTNLSLLQPVRFRPGAVWWWIVPVASLFMPYRAVRELSEAGLDQPALRRWWWGLFIAWNAGSGLFFQLPQLLGASLAVVESLSIVAGVIGLLAAVLAIRVVRLVDQGIDSRRAQAGWPLGRSPLHYRHLVMWGSGAILMAASGALTIGLALPVIEQMGTEAMEPTTSGFDVGTCFNETGTFPESDCAEPHDAEVFALIDHPDQAGYPGEQAITEWAEPLCYARFETYTGVAYEESPLDFGYLYPTAEGWVAGDRQVICYLFDPSGALNAPIRSNRSA